MSRAGRRTGWGMKGGGGESTQRRGRSAVPVWRRSGVAEQYDAEARKGSPRCPPGSRQTRAGWEAGGRRAAQPIPRCQKLAWRPSVADRLPAEARCKVQCSRQGHLGLHGKGRGGYSQWKRLTTVASPGCVLIRFASRPSRGCSRSGNLRRQTSKLFESMRWKFAKKIDFNG